MPVIAAAVCPHPPVLLPEAAGDAAAELDGLRTACAAALARLFAAAPEAVLLVGGDLRTGRYGPHARGSFQPYGVDTVLTLNPDAGAAGRGGGSEGRPGPDDGLWPRLDLDAELPLSLAVGAWLLARAGTDLPRLARGVAVHEPPERCGRLGAALHTEDSRRLALLVMGDGSACRGVKAPGYDDPRAVPYDDEVAAALADADPDALLGLDPTLSTELRVAGRAPWQVLAGAVRAAGGTWRGALDHYTAPYGVAYFVASWEPA